MWSSTINSHSPPNKPVKTLLIAVLLRLHLLQDSSQDIITILYFFFWGGVEEITKLLAVFTFVVCYCLHSETCFLQSLRPGTAFSPIVMICLNFFSFIFRFGTSKPTQKKTLKNSPDNFINGAKYCERKHQNSLKFCVGHQKPPQSSTVDCPPFPNSSKP